MTRFYHLLLGIILFAPQLCAHDNNDDTARISAEEFLKLVERYNDTGLLPGQEPQSTSAETSAQPQKKPDEIIQNKRAQKRALFFSTVGKMLAGLGVAVASQDPGKILGGACSMVATIIEFAIKTSRPDLMPEKEEEVQTRSPKTQEQKLLQRLEHALNQLPLLDQAQNPETV